MTAEKFGPTHFIGIGGAGMSGLATILLQLGYPVSGSDIKASPTTARLQSMGATVYIGHKKEHLPTDTELVVVSTAIAEDNPEVLAAKELSIPVIHRGEMLSRLMRRQKGIAVSGAHGKTTTTGMISVVLSELGLDPTVYIGGYMATFGSNARLGHGDYFVAEADESDASFLKLYPHIAVVTNVENDHLDHYGSMGKIQMAFRQFVRQVPQEGLVVLCNDDPFLHQLKQDLRTPVVTYGIDTDADVTARNITTNSGGKADIWYKNSPLGTLKLSVPGKHNLLNALAAICVALELKLPFKEVAAALETYQGVNRRFQTIGRGKGIWVVDDYAHHPTEIRATIAAARNTGAQRIVIVFQPHRYTRTKQLYKEFSQAIQEADLVVLDEVYSAGEKPIPGVSSQLIYQEVTDKQKVRLIRGKEAIVDFLTKNVASGDLVLTLGAGNVWEVAELLVKRMGLNEDCLKPRCLRQG